MYLSMSNVYWLFCVDECVHPTVSSSLFLATFLWGTEVQTNFVAMTIKNIFFIWLIYLSDSFTKEEDMIQTRRQKLHL